MDYYVNFDERKSLLELANDNKLKDNHSYGYNEKLLTLASKPVFSLEPSEFLWLINNNYYLEYTIPLSFEYIHFDLFEKVDNYNGDLLDAVLNCDKAYWRDHMEYKTELINIMSDVITELKSKLEEFLEKLLFPFSTDKQSILKEIKELKAINIEINYDTKKTLTELENFDWGPPVYLTAWGEEVKPTRLIEKCHSLRYKKLRDFTKEDLRFMVLQEIGLKFLMPLALKILQTNILAEEDGYGGEILYSVFNINTGFWVGDKENRNNFLFIIINTIENLEDKMDRFAAEM